MQFFKYPHGEQNCAIFWGGTSCKLAVFDLGKEVSFGLSFDQENWEIEALRVNGLCCKYKANI